jgi:hypothetical protein
MVKYAYQELPQSEDNSLSTKSRRRERESMVNTIINLKTDTMSVLLSLQLTMHAILTCKNKSPGAIYTVIYIERSSRVLRQIEGQSRAECAVEITQQHAIQF